MSTKAPRFELPEDRPASFDETGHHVALNPADVRGLFRRYRTYFYWFLIVIFLALPWTKFGGHQTVLIDIPQRRFAFFGITFWAHDVPLIFFILGILTVGLTLITAVWGRVWCGWGCPQTVFIDAIYRKIERWIEGDHIKRIRLAQAPLSPGKLFKKSLKWGLFWFISTNIAHSFTAYFIGAERLLGMSLSAPQENWTAFIFVTVITGMIMFDFGWFREQFCVIMCPYGRFQSVLMDSQSLAIMYDEGRGEPRKGREPEGQEAGDCVNCYRCVAVCPTGVDIRRGIQMECVACTACIDACDEIMLKVKKPKGLIRYSSETEMAGGKSKLLRARSLLYVGVLAVLFLGFSISVAVRQALDIKFIRAVDTPYTQATLPDGSAQIINHYKVSLRNQSFDTQQISVRLGAAALADSVEIVAPTYPLSLEGGKSANNHIFLKFPKPLTLSTGKYMMTIIVSTESERGDETYEEELKLVGPF